MAKLTNKAAAKLAGIVAQVERENEPRQREDGVPSLPPRKMHLGIIQAKGPLHNPDPECDPEKEECPPDEPKPDFTDSRYWVQAAFISNSTNTVDEAAEVEKYDIDQRPDRFRLLAVTNLFEQPLGTHALAPGQVVSFWQQPDRSTSPAPIARWLMNIVTSPIQFCVVRSIQRDEHFVTVQLARLKVRPERGEQWNGQLQTFGEAFEAACYPIMKGRHFQALIVPGSGEQDINQGWPVLQLLFINGIWFVSPWTKRFLVPITHADGLRLSDCNPLQGIER